jgi:hypothetical protein
VIEENSQDLPLAYKQIKLRIDQKASVVKKTDIYIPGSKT